MSNFPTGKHEGEMSSLMSLVSVAFMLYVMSYLAVNCAAEENKTAKQTSSIVVCSSAVLHADIILRTIRAHENTQRPQLILIKVNNLISESYTMKESKSTSIAFDLWRAKKIYWIKYFSNLICNKSVIFTL